MVALLLLCSTLVFAFSSERLSSPGTVRNTFAFEGNNSTIQNVTFTLLAVENTFKNATTKSAEQFIKTLITYNNWRNDTVSAGFQYFSYIQLLSAVEPTNIDKDCQPFYEGSVTEANLMDEISTFLDKKLPIQNDSLSVRIFYYAGDTFKTTNQGNTSYCLALDQPVYDWELDQALRGDQEDNLSTTVVILDASYSGGFVEKLAQPGRIILTACSPDEIANAQAAVDQENGIDWSWFTGAETATYSNGTDFGPLGMVGGIMIAEDLNHDGWRSADEIFEFASQTARWYALNQTSPENGEQFNMNSWAYFGVAGGAVPIVQYGSSAPFPGIGKALQTPPDSPDPYRYDSEEFQYRMYRYSSNHEDFSAATGPDTSSVLWTHFLSDPIASSASVADGMIFVGTMGGTFYALELATGETVWSFSIGSSISSTPAIEDGIVIFGSQKPGRIYALDEYTGIVRWVYEVPDGSSVFSSPMIKDDRVFVTSSDGYLRSFTLFEGALLWETYVGGNITASPAAFGDTVFIAGIGVEAFDESTGTKKWQAYFDWPVSSSPAVDGEAVYVGAENDDTVYALNATTGAQLWSCRRGGWISSPCVDSAKNLVIVGCKDGRVYCLNKATGSVEWSFITEGRNDLSAPTLSADGLVYAGSLNGGLFCLNENTGQKIWTYMTGGPVISSPTIVDQHVLTGSSDGYLYCFGPPMPTHDVAILNVTTASKMYKPGELVQIDYSAENFGNTAETVTIIFAYNKSSIWISPTYSEPTVFHIETVTIKGGETINNTYVWNTSSIQCGEYSIVVQAMLVPDEVEASNNVFLDSSLLLRTSTDLDANGVVNIIDVTIVARAFGSRPGDEKWNQNADLDNNGIINIIDVAAVAKDFGKTG
jgi:outer membrane protein assembly factor BamB